MAPADEDHGEVVADEVPVPVLGIELDGEAAWVTSRLRGVPTSRDRREAQGDIRARALLEHLGAGELGDGLVAPRARSLEVAVGGHPAGVHHSLGDALTVEVADLLEELVVLQRRRPSRADGALVLAVGTGWPCRLVSVRRSSSPPLTSSLL